ncbi:protein MAIN-LIKE 2-like [Papaver somniferum]|uniref:protein MAIN-LIKE 2-like n=1 Tax=Papaver somniferum TaxID=3469 RepID=UPI000E6F7355|nr:protein MAIN-LIKE 2-like [Papaver somniferum]
MFEFNLCCADFKLTEALMERWWKKTMSFHFPEFELGITPLDFVRLTGIPIGGGRKLPTIPVGLKKRHYIGYDSTYLSCVKENHGARTAAYEQAVRERRKGDKVGVWDSSASVIPISFLVHYINSRENQNNEGVWEELTRIFLLWCIGRFLLGNTTTRVSKGWLELLQNFHNLDEYDWGSAALGNLYDCLDRWTTSDRDEMGRMWNIVEYWYYFYFRNCQPFLRIDETIINNQCIYPAILLFRKDNHRGQVDRFKHSISVARHQIDMRTGDAVIWQPWRDDEYSGYPEVLEARNLSYQRVVFYGVRVRG